MKNIITSIIAATIIAAMLSLSLIGCYLLYNAFPAWFQYGLGLGSFTILVTTALINLWGKEKGVRKKDKLKKDYQQFLKDKKANANN